MPFGKIMNNHDGFGGVCVFVLACANSARRFWGDCPQSPQRLSVAERPLPPSSVRANFPMHPTLVLLFSLLPSVVAQTTLLYWNFAGQVGGSTFSVSGIPAPTLLAANLAASGLTHSMPALGGTAAGSAWGRNNFIVSGTQASAITANNFFSFTVAPTPGYAISYTSIPAYNLRRSGTGPKAGIWQYKVASGAFTDIGTSSFTTTATTYLAAAVSLSGIPALQSVSSEVTFRIVFWDASGSTGTMYINNVGGALNQDLAITGTVVAASTASPTTSGMRSVTPSASPSGTRSRTTSGTPPTLPSATPTSSATVTRTPSTSPSATALPTPTPTRWGVTTLR